MIKFSEPRLDSSRLRFEIKTPAGECVLLYRKPTDVEVECDQWRNANLQGTPDRGAAQAQLWAGRRACIVGWEGVCDADGNPVSFSQSSLLSLLLRVGELETQLYTLLSDLFYVEPLLGEHAAPREDSSAAQAVQNSTT